MLSPATSAALRSRVAEARAVRLARATVRRYAASESDLHTIFQQIHPSVWHGETRHDTLPREVAADALDDLDRPAEAQLMRTRLGPDPADRSKPMLPVYLDNGVVRPVAALRTELETHGRGGVNPAIGMRQMIEPTDRDYLSAALWSSMDDADPETGGEPLDANHGIGDIHPATLAQMVADNRLFHSLHGHLIGDNTDRSGHDFWLTRNGHGTGFRDHDDEYGGMSHELEDAAHRFGEYDLDVGDDGMIHGRSYGEHEEPPDMRDEGLGPDDPPYTGGMRGAHYARAAAAVRRCSVNYNGKEYPTDDQSAAMIRAAVNERPAETPLHALADSWMERGDARGDILRRWLEGNRVDETAPGVFGRGPGSGSMADQQAQMSDTKSVVEHRSPFGWGTPHALTRVSFHRPYDPVTGQSAADRVHVGLNLATNTGGGTRHVIAATPDEARQFVRGMGNVEDYGGRWTYKPGGTDALEWLDRHYGPEQKPAEPTHLARQYAAYRSPAGSGVVVRGTFYPPGKMIPDLKKFLPPEKLDRLKARARTRKKKVVESRAQTYQRVSKMARKPRPLYRGNSPESGTKSYRQGKGLYLTTSPEYAAQCGEVQEYPPEAAPQNPLKLRSEDHWDGWLIDQYVNKLGMKNVREFNEKYPDPGEYVRSLGYDGVQIGDGGKDTTFVNYHWPREEPLKHKRSASDRVGSEMKKLVGNYSAEELDGLKVLVHPDGRIWIDEMDWHDGKAGKQAIAKAIELVGKQNVKIMNEGMAPKDKGWIEIADGHARKLSRAYQRANKMEKLRKYAASHSDLAALYKNLRENPYDDTGHIVAADALEELHPDSPIPALVRRQFDTGGERPNNLWYEPVENSWDGTFPYTARLGQHGPFNVYLGHEGDPPIPGMSQGSNQRWVVHAVSRLPGSRDFGYTFEFPHDRAHELATMFPAAQKHIHSKPITGEYASQARSIEAQRFGDRMDEEERRRG